MDNHGAHSIATTHLGHLFLSETLILMMTHDVFCASFEVEKLGINRVSVNYVLHIPIVEDLAGYSYSFVEVNSVINNYAY